MKHYETPLNKALLIVFSLICVAFFALPLLWLLTAPFNRFSTLAVQLPSHPTLDNFRRVFDNQFAMRALFRNNLIIAGGAMLSVGTVATLASYGLSRTRVPGKDMLVYVLMLFSSVVGGTAAMVPIFLLANSLGLVDTHIGVILVMTGGFLPAAIFMMRDFPRYCFSADPPGGGRRRHLDVRECVGRVPDSGCLAAQPGQYARLGRAVFVL
jgi:multiple sugar transport system permease protein